MENGGTGLDQQEATVDVEEALKVVCVGCDMRRVRKRGSVGKPHMVRLTEDHEKLIYIGRVSCLPERLKSLRTTEILEVRAGWSTDGFNTSAAKRKFAETYNESCCFSIIFRHKVLFQKSIDLIVPSAELRKAWVVALKRVIAEQKGEMLHMSEQEWLKKQFQAADDNKNGTLSFKEVWRLLQKLNIEVDAKYAKQIFRQADFRKEGHKTVKEEALDSDEFVAFFEKLTHRADLEEIMSQFSSAGKPILLPEDLKEFLAMEQQQPVTAEKCLELIEEFEPGAKGKETKVMTHHGFAKFLMSDWGRVMAASHRSVHQDMTLSLPNYYINSSHNTYLTGHQLRGDASVEGYVNALKLGSRLLELDCYDGPDGEPIVTHGHTLVKPIMFKDAIEAINRYAFLVSDYPVILSIENHCSVAGQVRMRDIANSIFGAKLFYRDWPRGSEDYLSPAEMKKRIIIKAKKLPPNLADEDEALVSESDENDMSGGEENGSVGDSKAVKKVSGPSAPLSQSRRSESSSATRMSTASKATKKVKVILAKEFSEIVGLQAKAVHKVSLDLPKLPCDSFTSWKETKMLDELLVRQHDVVKLTAKRLVKSYPKGMRTDSSNMDPVPQWLAGVQCVTMNMQTPGLELDLNHGMFKQNGGCGFVLKPSVLREGRVLNTDEFRTNEPALILHVKVISGQYLPKPGTAPNSDDVLDPYVSLEVFGIPADAQKFRTKTIMNNGFNPLWNEQFTFQLKMPDVALLRFCVMDYDLTSANDFVGQNTIPVKCLAPGFRDVRLFNERLEELVATRLLVQMWFSTADAPNIRLSRDQVHHYFPICYRHVRLFTGSAHCLDAAATLFVHVRHKWVNQNVLGHYFPQFSFVCEEDSQHL